MKNILKKRLFTNLLINENGKVYKESRKWVAVIGFIIGSAIFGAGIIALLILSLLV